MHLVIFDCDGTLVDSQHTIVETMKNAFSVSGLPEPEAEAIRRVVGLSLLECMARLAPDEPNTRHHELVEGYRAAYAAQRRQADRREPLFPGVRSVIEDLEAGGALLAVATGKSLAGLKRTLDEHELRGKFMSLQTADLNPGKPHPGMIERAIEETGADSEATVMVGDTTFDMEMAGNAGALAIGVSWGYHGAEELTEAGAHAVIDAFKELPALVDALLGRNS